MNFLTITKISIDFIDDEVRKIFFLDEMNLGMEFVIYDSQSNLIKRENF